MNLVILLVKKSTFSLQKNLPMKLKIAMLAIIFLMASKITSQNVSVEKSIFGIQTGILGIWVHNESRLSNKIALRTEIGFDVGYRDGSGYDKVIAMAPVLTLEPRWYYNLYKRNNKGYNTANNSANFVALKVSYRPDWFTISNKDDISIIDQVSIVPYWSIRRSIGLHFSYETGIGLGYNYLFYSNQTIGEAAAELHLRIGYMF